MRSPQTEEIVSFQAKQLIQIMPDKNYVERYINRARTTENEAEKNNCLYRAGTQMEVIESNGNDKLTSAQQRAVFDAADKLLGRKK